jgi:hypothetical protein
MSLFFLVLKIFPFFGISLGVVFLDLARNLKRKGNKSWMGMIFMSALMMGATGAWVYFRGDKNADFWFARLSAWLQVR